MCVCVCFVWVCVGVDFMDLTVTLREFTDMRRVLNYACAYDECYRPEVTDTLRLTGR